MAKLFRLKINTPGGIFFEDDILQIELATPAGYVGILADHQPVIGALIPSLCYIRDNRGNRLPAIVNGGMFRTDGKTINIITDFFDFTEHINESTFAKRKARIEQIASRKFTDNKVYEQIQLQLSEQLNKLRKLAGK
jgi:F-type H+-transporting ATPase subunit epsilon